MKPRHRAQHRLDRTVVGDAYQEPRALSARLCARATADSAWELLDLSSSELVWEHRAVAMPQYQLPKIESYAPLLKRVIRNPYAMECEGARRIQQFDSSRPPLRREERESLRLVFRAGRDARTPVSPIQSDRLPSAPPVPFSRCREAMNDRAEDQRFGMSEVSR